MGIGIEVLGPLRVTGDATSNQLARPSHRRLLSILALWAGRRIGTDVLIDRFWGGDPPREAKAALQTHVSALRRLLTPNLIVTEGYGYRLDLDSDRLDASKFVALTSDARHSATEANWERSLDAAESALRLWRGRPYAELEDDDFAEAEINRLELLHLELFELKAGALLGMGRNAEALSELEGLVVEHPMRERLWEYLMTARYRQGRHAEALRAYRELSDLLAEMGLEPGPSIRRLEEKILLHHEELSAPPHSLPTDLTSFIGRDSELSDIVKLLAEHRLLTLTGVGGSGKTRLALRAAADHLTSFPDGCWFVNLADLNDPDLIAIEVADVVGLKPQSEDALEALVASVRQDTILFVLDNCEHLREGAAAVAQSLIGAGKKVKVLATSRERLHVPGEVVYDVPPLAAPPQAAPTFELRAYDAVKLFEDRAVLVDPKFLPDDEAYALIGSICRRLDGIPLAIELMAAKMGSFGLELIDDRLGDRLLFLTGSRVTEVPRHQTLEAAIGWSYELLGDEEQRLFARLSVFRGGFDIEMTRQLAANDSTSEDAVMLLVESLLEKSLVTRERSTPNRYRLLEPVREFAHDRLRDSNEEVETRRRHLDWCVGLASELEDKIFGVGRHELLARLGVEIENLHAGLEFAVEVSDAHAISRIAGATAWHWMNIGANTRSRDALLLALANVGEEVLREGELRSRLAHVRWMSGQSDGALPEAIHSRKLVRDLEASPQKAAILSRLSILHSVLVDQDPRQAITLARESVSVAEASRDAVVVVRSQTKLGGSLCWAGEVEEGLEVLRRTLAEALHIGDPSITLDIYNAMFSGLYLHPEERRDGPRNLVEDLLARFPLDEWIQQIEPGWLPYIFMQIGEWDGAEDAIRRYQERRLEGYQSETNLMTHGTLCWMRGDLDGAAAAMTELEEGGVNPRWYHDYYPLRVDIATDTGDLEAARAYAEAYLSVEVDPSEEAKKLGVLNPLVRAEVNDALAKIGQERDVHLANARTAVERMHAILDRFAPPSEGSLAMETHATHLAIAEAELSRLTGPDPNLWQEAVDRADYIYFRLYARFRLAEVLGQLGDTAASSSLLEEVSTDVTRVGALGLKRLIEAERY
jgi:predicted ATPase/DNA-binding winged helix-turn-helix (wHTH) protein